MLGEPLNPVAVLLSPGSICFLLPRSPSSPKCHVSSILCTKPFIRGIPRVASVFLTVPWPILRYRVHSNHLVIVFTIQKGCHPMCVSFVCYYLNIEKHFLRTTTKKNNQHHNWESIVQNTVFFRKYYLKKVFMNVIKQNTKDYKN